MWLLLLIDIICGGMGGEVAVLWIKVLLLQLLTIAAFCPHAVHSAALIGLKFINSSTRQR